VHRSRTIITKTGFKFIIISRFTIQGYEYKLNRAGKVLCFWQQRSGLRKHGWPAEVIERGCQSRHPVIERGCQSRHPLSNQTSLTD